MFAPTKAMDTKEVKAEEVVLEVVREAEETSLEVV